MTLKYNPITWAIRQGAWRFGFDICSYINMKALLSDCNELIDVGANDGDTYTYFRSFGFKGKIICFEPSPVAFSKLANMKTENCVKYNFCCGEESGEIDFYVKGGNCKHDSIYNNGGKKITVESRRVDSFEVKGERIFFKVDTEGHDLSVFRGASGLHSRIMYVLMEVPIKGYAETIAEMKRLGFVCINSVGNIFSADRKRSQAFDLVFAHENK